MRSIDDPSHLTPDERRAEVAERVPPKYNTQTELTETVESKSQENNFTLTDGLNSSG